MPPAPPVLMRAAAPLLAALILCAAGTPALAEVRHTQHAYPNGLVDVYVEAPRCALVIEGLMDTGAAKAIDAGLKQMQVLGCKRPTMVFNSGGGTPAVGYRLADFLSKHRFDTAIADGGQCFSACAYAFLGGRNRHVADRGRFGVHQHSSAGVCARELSEAEDRRMRSIMQRVLEPAAMEQLIALILATDCGRMHVLEREEIEALVIANAAASPLSPALRSAIAGREARRLEDFRNAAGSEWTRAASDRRLAVYLRESADAGPGGLPAVWGLIDHAAPRVEAISGERFRTHLVLSEVDCDKQTISVVRGLYTRDAMGQGPVVWATGRLAARPVRPKTTANYFYRAACGRPLAGQP
jgi:hypothetical protein